MSAVKSLLIALGFVGLGLAYLWQASGLPAARADDLLGPATMPFALGIALIVLAITLGAAALAGGAGDAGLVPVRRHHLVVLLGILAYVAAVPFAGFKASTALFLFAGALWGGQRVVPAGLFAIGMAILFHLVFELLFRVALPRGLM